MATLQDILIRSNSYLDLTAELPTGDDLTVRINYAQQAIDEWANAYQWRQLKKEYTLSVTGASVSLPSDFRELLAPPNEFIGQGNYVEYPEIIPETKYGKEAADKYSYILGNRISGHTLILNGLSSGATLSVSYQGLPSSMATLSDVCEVPDAEYVKMKIISYTLQSRSDERFPIVDAEASRLLQNMIGREQIQAPGGTGYMRRTGAAAWAIGKSRG